MHRTDISPQKIDIDELWERVRRDHNHSVQNCGQKNGGWSLFGLRNGWDLLRVH